MFDSKNRSLPRRWFVILVMVALAIGTSCAQKRKATTISGKITFNGQPVSVGAIYFHGEDDQVAMATINKDGSFTATDVPLGNIRVSLQVRDPGTYAKQLKESGENPMTKDPAQATLGVTNIPSKYADAKTSGLVYPITSSTTTLEVKIE